MRAQGSNVYTSGSLSIISSRIRAGLELAGTTIYVLPAPPGHWVPAARCEVWREACGQYDIALACKAAAVASCSTDTTNNVDTCSPSGSCKPATANQPCDWRTSPDLIDKTVYVLPLGTHNLDYPFVCAPGIRGGDGSNPSEQTSAFCAGLCPPGFTCGGGEEGVKPVACPEAHYCPEGSSVALPCPAGKFGNVSGLQAEHECHTCPAGHFCGPAVNKPTACSRGTVAPNASMVACNDCEAGTYQEEAGQTACGSCRPGSFCPAGASARLPCAEGSYSAVMGLEAQAECTVCPAGTYCFAGSTAATSCSKGTYAATEGSQLCAACPEGKYQGHEGASACNECSSGYTCPEGSVVQIPASCDPGTYLNVTFELCLGCPAGSFCLGGSLQPRLCVRGTYCVANVSQPIDCPAGRYGSVPGLSDALCSGECAQGYYCGAGSMSAKSAPCEAGRYSSQAGQGSAASCGACGAGNYCFAGSTSPTPCGKGTATADPTSQQCPMCAEGKYQGEDGATECVTCGDGFMCPPGSSARIPASCDEGTFLKSGVTFRNQDDCETCPVAKWCPGGRTPPKLCSAGTFADTIGLAQCVDCPAGTFQSKSGATACDPCTPGSYCEVAAAAVSLCQVGTYSSAPGLSSSSECMTCPAGSSCLVGSVKPIPCRPGSVQPLAGQGTCMPCAAGSYQSESNAKACVACAAGSYCTEGAVVASPCTEGTYSNAAGLGSRDGCTVCPTGTFCFAGATAPMSCSKGTYAASERSQLCDACPAGSYQNLEGQTACKVCIKGSYCEVGSTTPLLCAAGTYGNTTGLRGINDCKDAPPDFYAQAGSILPKACPSWGFCPGRQLDDVNDVPGSIPIVVPDGQQTQTTTEVVQQTVNQTVLQLPLQIEVDDVNTINETAIQLQVARMLGLPLHSMSLNFGTSRRRLAHLFRARLRRLLALDFVVTITEEPAVDIATVESLWRSKNVSTLSAELGIDVTDAPSPVVANKVIVRNSTVSTLVLVGCGAGYWGANGQCIPCAKGTYRLGGTNRTECLECPAGTYQPFLGGSECISCGAGNYSANTLSCEPCQVGEFCAAGTQVGMRCPLAHSTTLGRGARGEDDCVCQAGYFLGNSSCEVCPTGTDCSSVGVSVASLPLLPGWWRLQNSTQLERCFATSNCTGGGNANELCGVGYEGPFCGSCAAVQNGSRYHRSVGRCKPCEGSVVPAMIGVLLALGVLLMLGLAFRQSARSRRMLRKLNQKFEDGRKIEEMVEEMVEEEIEDMAEGSAGAASQVGRAKTWQFELPDIELALIEAALHANFPHLDWPKLPELRLHELQLPKINWSTLWPAAPSLAFLVNLLHISLPSLTWPTLPSLDLPEWEWSGWEIPPIHLSKLLALLRERFPNLTWPELPDLTLLDLPLPRVTFTEFKLTPYPHLAPWPSPPDITFLFNMLRIAFPDIEWPIDLSNSGGGGDPPDLSLPDWTFPELEDPDWDLGTSFFSKLSIKLRILVSMIQVLSQLSVVYSIPFPGLYAGLLRWVGLLELNFVDILPLGCVATLSFHTTLLVRTLLLPGLSIIPILLHLIRAPARVLELCRGVLFLVLFLIYPSTSAAIFATFHCEELSDGTSWLRADLSIDCAGAAHAGFRVYAAAMILIYPLGTPVLYYLLLRRSRVALEIIRVNQTLRVQLLNTEQAEGDYVSSRASTGRRQVAWLLSAAERKALPVNVLSRLRRLEWEEYLARKQLPGSISKLVNGYEVRMWWFEIFECVRKLAVACLPVFFQPSGSPSQLVWGLVVCFVAFGLYVHFDPYEERGDNAVAALCQMQIFFSLLASVALTSASGAVGTNMDVLLVVLYFLPVGLAIFLESPLLPCYQRAVRRLTGRFRVQSSEKKELHATSGQVRTSGQLSCMRRAESLPPFLGAEIGQGNHSKKTCSVRARYSGSHSTSVSSIHPAPPEVMVEDLGH